MLDKKAFCVIKDDGQTHGLVAFTQSTTFFMDGRHVCCAVYFRKASLYTKKKGNLSTYMKIFFNNMSFIDIVLRHPIILPIDCFEAF